MRYTTAYAEIPKPNTKSPCVAPTREIALFLSWMNMKSWIISGTYDLVRRLLPLLLTDEKVARKCGCM